MVGKGKKNFPIDLRCFTRTATLRTNCKNNKSITIINIPYQCLTRDPQFFIGEGHREYIQITFQFR
jgi:hypothetical protein